MIRGNKRKIPKVEIPISIKLHNKFTIEVVDSVTGQIKQKAQAENVICNQLWTKLLTPATYFNYIHYGTGSGTPSATDTHLFTFLGYKTPNNNDDVYLSDVPNEYISLTRKVILNPEDNVGAIITEVGIASDTGSTSLCTHAMLKDMNGNTITITKSSTDLINIYATVFVHVNKYGYDSNGILITFKPQTLYIFLLGRSTSISIGHIFPTYGFTDTGGIDADTEDINISSLLDVPVSTVYSSAAKTITLTATRVSASKWNNREIHGLMFSGNVSSVSVSGLSLALDPKKGTWYPESTIIGETIGTGDGANNKFSTLFSLADNVKIYVDGVEVLSGITKIKRPKSLLNMERYFIGIDEASVDGALIYNLNTYTLMYNSNHPPYNVTQIYFNPYYELGILEYYVLRYYSGYPGYKSGYSNLYISNDLINWVYLGDGTVYGTHTLQEEYRYYKYWKSVPYTNYPGCSMCNFKAADNFNGNNIIFDTPPAAGAVITADYTTKAIAKDANHVFDVSVVISLGEYTP